ncbi:hypothetical protein GINT2_000319 [Glugoides intestinalis]
MSQTPFDQAYKIPINLPKKEYFIRNKTVVIDNLIIRYDNEEDLQGGSEKNNNGSMLQEMLKLGLLTIFCFKIVQGGVLLLKRIIFGINAEESTRIKAKTSEMTNEEVTNAMKISKRTDLYQESKIFIQKDIN